MPTPPGQNPIRPQKLHKPSLQKPDVHKPLLKQYYLDLKKQTELPGFKLRHDKLEDFNALKQLFGTSHERGDLDTPTKESLVEHARNSKLEAHSQWVERNTPPPTPASSVTHSPASSSLQTNSRTTSNTVSPLGSFDSSNLQPSDVRSPSLQSNDSDDEGGMPPSSSGATEVFFDHEAAQQAEDAKAQEEFNEAVQNTCEALDQYSAAGKGLHNLKTFQLKELLKSIEVTEDQMTFTNNPQITTLGPLNALMEKNEGQYIHQQKMEQFLSDLTYPDDSSWPNSLPAQDKRALAIELEQTLAQYAQ